ncbi:Regulatory protein Spx [Lactococcus lactis subsp. lactis]|uniref:Regulatory protein Spx n=1 Tax=Lactococcus lactis subsp. lactis TaxID=1360 RepID=A0A2R7Y291_LACLL|nr:Regulatory protein Spx [Lactococcus lactis subsp. lactis]
MIKLYLSPSCSSCRKAKAWLISNHIFCEEINIRNTLISEKELFHILSLIDSGADDIISKRSLLYQKLNLNFNDIILSDAVKNYKRTSVTTKKTFNC